MSTNEENQKILQSQFINNLENRKFLEEEKRHLASQLLQIKVAFVGFIGVMLTIAVGNSHAYQKIFLIWFTFLVLICFLLMIIELWRYIAKAKKDISAQDENVILSHIQRISYNDNSLASYGIEAQKKRETKDTILSAMLKGEKLDKILSDLKNEKEAWFDKNNLVFWAILVFLIPVSFLIQILLNCNY